MKMNDTKASFLVGVGGQGTILASKILSEGLVRKGYDVMMSEIHGMSQRGGSVTTHVRFGTEVSSCSSRRRSGCPCCIRKGRGGTLA